MEYFPLGLKAAHIGVVGLGLYIAIEGQNQLHATSDPGGAVLDGPDTYVYGFSKETFLLGVYVVTVIALAQLFVLFYYHNFDGKESYFRGSFFVLALINIIFSAIVLQGAVTLLDTSSAYTDSGTQGTVGKLTGDREIVAIAAAVFGALVVTFSFVNFYHASMPGNRSEVGIIGKRSPRRK